MIVVKVGGGANIDVDSVLHDVAALHKEGTRVVLVHGASDETNKLSERLGIPPRFMTVAENNAVGRRLYLGSGFVVIDENEIPGIIDELPIIFALAALSKGRTVIKGASELRVKETDRTVSSPSPCPATRVCRSTIATCPPRFWAA